MRVVLRFGGPTPAALPEFRSKRRVGCTVMTVDLINGARVCELLK